MNNRDLAIGMINSNYNSEFVIDNVIEMLETKNGYKVLLNLCDILSIHTSIVSKLLNNGYSFDRCIYFIEKNYVK